LMINGEIFIGALAYRLYLKVSVLSNRGVYHHEKENTVAKGSSRKPKISTCLYDVTSMKYQRNNHFRMLERKNVHNELIKAVATAGNADHLKCRCWSYCTKYL
jgi:hypothetical protein